MEEVQLFIKELRPNLYLFDEGHATTGYLLIGQEKACMIDTMNGLVNSYEEVRKLTDKPVMVVNTHGHPDHICGNIYYEKAYMNLEDMAIANEFLKEPAMIELCERQNRSMPPFEAITEGDVLDLGGVTLQCYNLPGHTPGGILLLCPEERILFTGDGINHHLWMQLDHSLSIEDLVASLERVQFLTKEADYILHGHSNGFDDISLYDALLQGARDLVAGKCEEDLPYEWFEGVDLQHPFTADESKSFQQNHHVICYKKENIKR